MEGEEEEGEVDTMVEDSTGGGLTGEEEEKESLLPMDQLFHASLMDFLSFSSSGGVNVNLPWMVNLVPRRTLEEIREEDAVDEEEWDSSG